MNTKYDDIVECVFSAKHGVGDNLDHLRKALVMIQDEIMNLEGKPYQGDLFNYTVGHLTVFTKIRGWAEDRNLIKGATPAAQYQKLLEEVGELGRGLIEDNAKEVKDAIGDCVVVLTILAAQRGMHIEECIDAAYEVIKDRKGKMVNGIFVKEAQ